MILFFNFLEGQINEWLLTEKERFDSNLDKNKGGFLDEAETKEWLITEKERFDPDTVGQNPKKSSILRSRRSTPNECFVVS